MVQTQEKYKNLSNYIWAPAWSTGSLAEDFWPRLHHTVSIKSKTDRTMYNKYKYNIFITLNLMNGVRLKSTSFAFRSRSWYRPIFFSGENSSVYWISESSLSKINLIYSLQIFILNLSLYIILVLTILFWTHFRF